MRFGFYRWLLALWAGLACAPLCAQTLQERQVRFACPACTPAEALFALARQENFDLAFSDRLFARCPRQSYEYAGVALEQILRDICACAPVALSADDKGVVIRKLNTRYAVRGYVMDAETGERLIGATVRALPDGPTTRSNEFGFFSLMLESEEAELQAAYVGFVARRIPLSPEQKGALKIRLSSNANLPEVLVTDATSAADEHNGLYSGGRPVPLCMLGQLLMPGGEADLLRMLAMQTGVHTGADGLGGLHVRGGNADQNLFLLDDVPVYNPGHALGLFSIYNADLIQHAEFWKGDFPARYGGRASSVLDVRLRDGNYRQWRAGVSAGLFASSAHVEGPLVKDRSSVIAGLRLTYLGPWVRFFSRRGTLLSAPGAVAGYNFYDANLKWNYILNDRNKLFFSLYKGQDGFENRFFQVYGNPQGLIKEDYSLQSEWGNDIAALRWNTVLSPRFFFNTTLRYSKFDYRSDLDFLSEAEFADGRKDLIANYAQAYRTLIQDWSAKTDANWFSASALNLRGGLAITQHTFQPGALTLNYLIPGQSNETFDSLVNELFNNERLSALEGEWYTDADWRPAPHWRIEGGVFHSLFWVRDIRYSGIQPRIRAQWEKERGGRAWAGYHRSMQNLHQIGSFNISLPFELWAPSTERVPPEITNQWSAGAGVRRGPWNVQAEAYLKNMARVLTFLRSNDALYSAGAEDASGWEDRIASGRGHSRGIEITAEYVGDKSRYAVYYTLSKTTRIFPEINSGREFPFRYDRPHQLTLAVFQPVWRGLSLNVAWVFASGNPITLAGVKHNFISSDGVVNREIFLYSAVNNFRLPPYHRLDLSLRFQWGAQGRAKHDMQLGAYNAYNRINPFFLYVDANSPVRGRATQYSLLPLLPVFSYSLRL